MRRKIPIVVVPTSLYHYNLYRQVFLILIKIGTANVNFEDNHIFIHANPKWEKYKNQLGALVMETHEMYMKTLSSKAEQGS